MTNPSYAAALRQVQREAQRLLELDRLDPDGLARLCDAAEHARNLGGAILEDPPKETP